MRSATSRAGPIWSVSDQTAQLSGESSPIPIPASPTFGYRSRSPIAVCSPTLGAAIDDNSIRTLGAFSRRFLPSEAATHCCHLKLRLVLLASARPSLSDSRPMPSPKRRFSAFIAAIDLCVTSTDGLNERVGRRHRQNIEILSRRQLAG
jgi:hypothetical protein